VPDLAGYKDEVLCGNQTEGCSGLITAEGRGPTEIASPAPARRGPLSEVDRFSAYWYRPEGPSSRRHGHAARARAARVIGAKSREHLGFTGSAAAPQ
jgi:hypothetical protein